ncbi:hypothetical protein NF212_09800 [Parasalinivibrio latis]|uniref:tetratricopeptide repeat protein n=1 Tax=Parasalinivibrio latis TaxID=2952610 RepID=UPI0030E18738
MAYFKWFLLSVFLFGCQSASHTVVGESVEDREEALMQSAGNNQGLIALYKSRLLKADNPETRLKLANSYFVSKDYESAKYHAEFLKEEQRCNTGCTLLLAKVLHKQKAFNESLLLTDAISSVAEQAGETHNLRGLNYASLGEFEKARHAFEMARMFMFDDTAVKNNLAVVDIMTGQFELAIDRLMPLYVNGLADDTIKANLAIAAVKAGKPDYFSMIVKNEKNRESRYKLYAALQASSMTEELMP